MQQVSLLKNRQQQLQNESATGLKLSLPEDDPSSMGQVLTLQTSSSANTQYQSNIAALQTQATTASNAISSLKTITDRIGEIATLAQDGTKSAQDLSDYGSEVNQLLEQAVSIGNTKDADGNYIFGGTNTTAPPFVASYDQYGKISSVAFQGNMQTASAEISQGVTVTAQTLGVNGLGSGPCGLFSDSRSGADLFQHLISLRNDLNSGNTSAIASTDAPAATKDEDNLLYVVTANGAVQSQLQTASNLSTQQGLAITSQISNHTDADLAQTLTEFSQAQTAYQAALQSGVSVLNLSILSYL